MDALDRFAWLVCGFVTWCCVRWVVQPWRAMRVYRKVCKLCDDKGWTVELYPDADGLVFDVRDDGDLYARGRGPTAENAAQVAAVSVALRLAT
jgi:hypothetical protein